MCVQVHIFSIFYLSGNFSTKGSEFHFLIAGYTEILVSTDESEPVNFWVYWNKRTHPRTQSNTTHTVSRGKSVLIDIPNVLSINSNYRETPADIGIQLHSQDGKRLTVSQFLRSFHFIGFSFVLKIDAFLVFPKIETKFKTYEYFALFIPSAGFFGFVTTEPHTTITITPVTDITTFFVIFHSLIRGKNYTATVPAAGTSVIGTASSDLSGTRVISDKPLSFFVGRQYSRSIDRVLRQFPPTETWGFKFFLVPLSTHSADRYRILASRGRTECSVTCTNASLSETITLANPGDFKQLIYTTHYCSVECNHPILIFEYQYCEYDKYNMKMIPPVGQYSNDYDLYFSNALEGDTDLIKLAIPTEYDPFLLRFDGRPLSGVAFVNVSCSNGEVCGRVAMYHLTNATGSHKLVHKDPDARFIAIAYVCSIWKYDYGYVGGMKFDSIAGEFGNLLHCLVSK